MNLYNQKASNIRKTWALFCVCCIAVIGIGWIFSYIYHDDAILYIAIALSIGTNLVAYWSSDTIALASYQAHEADKTTHKELYRSVENLSITAGVPMPRVFVIPTDSPNAFATGRNPKHASIAVTQGLVDRLEPSELEGVLAHELSHVKNYDTLIMTVVVVLVGVLSLTAQLFSRTMMFGGGRRDSESNGANPLFMILGIVAIIVAPIAGTLLQFAISRKREFVADASAALLTRYPEGLAHALQKISTSEPFGKTKQATAHLFIANPMHLDAVPQNKIGFISKLFMTHPPIEERIKALMGSK